MITLFKGKYKLEDFEYLDEILDEILLHHCMRNTLCGECSKFLACKDLHRLHAYIHKAIEEEKNSSKR